MTKIVLAALAALMSLSMFSSDASAFGRRSGDFIHNGTIYVASRARDCDRGTGWHYRGGRRVWGPSNGTVYYQSPKFVRPRVMMHAPRQVQVGWQPSVNCEAMGGRRTMNPSTGRPSCLVP